MRSSGGFDALRGKAPRMTQTSRSMSLAMISAAVVAAQLAAGKATRDALFFTSLTITALPAVVTATALFSIGLVFLHGRAVRRVAPGTLVPILYGISGCLFI